MNQIIKIEDEDIAAQLFVNGLNVKVTRSDSTFENSDDVKVTIEPSMNQVVDWDMVGNPIQHTYEYNFEVGNRISKNTLSKEMCLNGIAAVLADDILYDIKFELEKRIQQKLYDIYIETPEERLMKAFREND